VGDKGKVFKMLKGLMDARKSTHLKDVYEDSTNKYHGKGNQVGEGTAKILLGGRGHWAIR
jgi:hypothetical protein